MKGLNYTPQPFIHRILIEDGWKPGPKQPGFTDLYHKKPNEPDPQNFQNKIKLTFDLVLKSLYPVGLETDNNCNSAYLKEAVNTLNTHVVYYKLVTEESVLVNFLLSEDKISYFTEDIPGKLRLHAQAPRIGNAKNYDLSAYVSYTGPTPIVTVPLKVEELYTPVNQSAVNPGFLACVVMYGPPAGVFGKDNAPATPTGLTPSNTFFTSEIIFRQGAAPAQSIYFTIGNTYMANGVESPLADTPDDIALQAADKGPENDSEYIIAHYG